MTKKNRILVLTVALGLAIPISAVAQQPPHHGGGGRPAPAARRRASRTSAMWPRCNAPIVGTSAILAPAFRYGSNARRSEGTDRKIFKAVAMIFGLVGGVSQNRNTSSKAARRRLAS